MMNHEELAAFIQECRSRGRRDELRSVLADLFAADPGNQEVQMNLGIELIASGDMQTALSLLAPLTEDQNFGGQLQAMLELGHLYQAAGDFDQAESHYRQGRANFPANHWPAIDLSLLAMARGRPGEAIEALRAGFNCSDAYGRALLRQRAASLSAQSHFNASHLLPDWADRPVQELNGMGHACLMIMMKDEQDIIAANLEHHYAMGFRTFCLIDNLSTDNTTAVIAAFREAHPEAFIVATVDPIRGYYQSNKMQVFTDFMLEYCKIADRRIEWMFYVDADEFLSCMGGQDRQSLSAALSDPTKSVLVFHWVNHASTQVIEGTCSDSPFALYPMLQITQGDLTSKVAVRVGLGLYPTVGNHFVITAPEKFEALEVAAEHGRFMALFPLRTLGQVRSKVINGGRAFQGTKGLEHHGVHWKARYDLYLTHGDNVVKDILQQWIDEVKQSRLA